MIVVNILGFVVGPLVTTAAVPPFLIPSSVGQSVYMVQSWYDAIYIRLYWRLKRCHQPDQQFLDKLPWGRWKMVDELTVFRFD